MIPRNEYPRPTLVRDDKTWQCLNGEWLFTMDTEKDAPEREVCVNTQNLMKITVPFVPESKLSGIEYTDPIFRVYYVRRFEIKEKAPRTVIHIGAMDYEGRVYINGKFAGEHRGGYTPYALDITEYLVIGENEIKIVACDDNENPLQPSGKQAADFPHGCFYTHCTGIWQTVWLEFLPEKYIKNVHFLPFFEEKGAKIKLFSETIGDGELSGKVFFGGECVSEFKMQTENGRGETDIFIENPVLWDVGEGNLYDVEVSFFDDSARSYFGVREIKISGNKVLLNGKELFQRLLLDQGYYLDGIYTAGSADEFSRDIDLCVAAGFNGSRMHMKIFEPGFIYEADKKGYLLWGEYPNWGLDISREEALGVMLPEWEDAMSRDMNHPSIIGWCPLNEAFPGENTALVETLVKRTKEIDPTRLVIDTSGYVHSAVGDIYDVHDYEQNPDTFREHFAPLLCGEKAYENPFDAKVHYDGKSPYFVSEFGGAFYDIDAVHESGEQESGNPWGYGRAPENEDEFIARLDGLCGVLRDNPAVCGFCYTQFTDVMQEMNGIFSYDRRIKFDMDRVRRAVAGE